MTVIEVARRAAGLSQRRLAQIARTQQSSVSKYESRRKSPASGSGRLAPQPALDRGLVAAVATAVSDTGHRIELPNLRQLTSSDWLS
jgi:transcriptional regulator with XRE-family HTH domain